MKPSQSILASLVPAVLLSVASTLPALAQTNSPRPAQKALSRAELRACIQREEELGQRHDSLRDAQDAHQRASAKLSADAMELSRMLRGTDLADEAAVDAYNRRNDARNAEVETHNKRAEALDATATELQTAEADFLATCASRPYLQADEKAVLKELGLGERRVDRQKRQAPVRQPGKSDT